MTETPCDTPVNEAPRIRRDSDGHQFQLSGTITQGNVTGLMHDLTSRSLPVGAEVKLDFEHAWIGDGLAMLVVVNTLRSLAGRVSRIRIIHPPAPLREALDQSGALAEHPGIRLFPEQEEEED